MLRRLNNWLRYTEARDPKKTWGETPYSDIVINPVFRYRIKTHKIKYDFLSI